MVVSEITLYNVLKAKLGEAEAQTVVEGTKQEVRNEFDNKKEILATKEDLAAAKADIIKWMFIFWAGSVGVISGIMIALLNAYLKR
jgi:hypothetical protein